VVHGLLHLLGYDDISPSARRQMRAAEKRLMGLLESEGLAANHRFV
jgi:ssRNA-specific RNase YbeY (16S rRNA maturation enzyme)